MSMLSKFNKGQRFTYQAPQGTEWYKLSDLVDNNTLEAVYPVKALYVNHKSKYGDEPVIVSSGALINAPQHLLSTVEEMLNDDEVVKYINDGNVSFKVYEYESKNGKGYSVRWIDNKES